MCGFLQTRIFVETFQKSSCSKIMYYFSQNLFIYSNIHFFLQQSLYFQNVSKWVLWDYGVQGSQLGGLSVPDKLSWSFKFDCVIKKMKPSICFQLGYDYLDSFTILSCMYSCKGGAKTIICNSSQGVFFAYFHLISVMQRLAPSVCVNSSLQMILMSFHHKEPVNDL